MNALQQMLAKKKALAEGSQPRPGEAGPSPSNIPAHAAQDSPVSDSTPTPMEQVKAKESTVATTNAPTVKRLLSTPKPPVKTPNIIDSNKLAAAVGKPELTVEALAASDGVIDDPHHGDRFKLTLDVLDAKLEEIGGKLDGFSIDTVRSIIARIMTDLKSHPDYESLYLGDRDVHNIMAFMYAVREAATEQNVKKVVKAEKKGDKQTKRVNLAAALDSIEMGDLKL